MTRPAVRPMVALLAALLLAVTVAPVPAYSASPGADRDPAAGLATIPFETRGKIGRFHDISRSGLVLGDLLDRAGGTDPVLWRSYDNPIPLDVPESDSMRMNERGHLAGVGKGDLAGVSWLRRPSGMTYLRWPGMSVRMRDLNDRGQVAGSLEHPRDATPAQPFRWQDGEFTLLEVPEGMSGRALKMNNRGDALGEVVNSDRSIEMAVLWRGTSMTVLSPPGGGMVRAFDLNDRGQVVGDYWPSGTDLLRPFRWERGRFIDLLPGRPDSVGGAYDINESGEIAGFADTRAVLWRGGRIVDIGVEGSADVINERGDVAGMHHAGGPPVDDFTVRAFRWRNGRLLYSEPATGPDIHAGVNAIDDRGRVVGFLINPGQGGAMGYLHAWMPAR
nr:hypothetical protein [Micromonospora sp. DSM 115978]